MSGTPLTPAAFDQLFLQAHTHNAWQDKPVADELLHRLYDTLRMAPTSMNCSPARIVFVKSKAAKEKLIPALMEGNRAKTMAAPVTAIIGYDTHFYDNLPKLFPTIPRRTRHVRQQHRTCPTSPPSATARCKALTSSSPHARWVSIAARCPASTTPPWTSCSSRERA